MSSKHLSVKLYREGRYFSEAVSWHYVRYAANATQRSAMLLLLLILLVGVSISVDAMHHSFATIRVPFTIYAKDQVNFFAQIKPISSGNDSLEASIVKYFASKYVTLRESYDANDFADDNLQMVLNKVKALSTHKTFRIFEEYIDPRINLKSPILLYKNQIKKTVEVKSVRLKTVGDTAEGAIIEFTTTEHSKELNRQQQHTAHLEFILSDLQKVFRGQEQFFFLVAHYETDLS
jgi:type IV secretory pathway component VirB8